MKKTFTLCAFMLAAGTSASFLFAQEHIQTPPDANGYIRCGQVMYENYLRSVDPKFDEKRAEADRIISEGAKQFLEARLNGNSVNTVYTIPIVVHILYNGSGQNPTDNQVKAAITQMNKDWSRTNADAANTPSAWVPRAVSLDVQFCLAQKDPSGNSTTGIIHKATSVASFTTDDKIKSNASGGDDTWPINQYFNIWIGNLGGGLLGYGSFPPPGSGYGTVVHYCTINGTCPPYNMGRTLCHENGHCFALYHIWGDDGGACTGSDQVADTPNMADATSGNPSGCVTDACGVGAGSNEGSNTCSPYPGRMYQNFMDYTDDAGYNMYTTGQKARVQSTVTSYLMALANNSSVVCSPPVALDAGISSIVSPNGTICNTSFTPVVTVKNFGTTTLTSCTINYHVDANPSAMFNWTGSLTTGQTANATLPVQTAAAGTHTFYASTSAPNSGSDLNTSNDLSSNPFVIGTTGAALPYTEAFGTFLPSGWTQTAAPANADLWLQNTTYGNPAPSALYNFCNPTYTATARVKMITTGYNFSAANSSAQMTFDVAYAPWDATYSDTLDVYYSTNCGNTWNMVYTKGGTTLATVPCIMSNTAACSAYADGQGCFIPNSSAWRNENVSLAAVVGQSNVLFAFEARNGYGSNLFVDNINLQAVVGVNELSQENAISVFPNPTDGTVNVSVNIPNAGLTSVKVYTVVGETVSELSDNIVTPKNFKVNLADKPNGIYFIEVKTNSGKATKKVVLNK
ncbi:MAG: T9SS type A sorting domain-containing protein [Bacteroidetes bacterium]|nr:T9SS type A sorting domain-containing protein [Bacteroidota bacterium]